jgi:hypothetical protein
MELSHMVEAGFCMAERAIIELTKVASYPSFGLYWKLLCGLFGR